jgi:hypothetical protein
VADADPLAAALEEVRERNEQLRSRYGYVGGLLVLAKAEQDVPRLLAAVEAVLAPHQPGRIVVFGSLCSRHEAHRYFSITAVEAASVRDCPECTATVYPSCTGCGPQVSAERCPIRHAITRALTGEEAR